MLSIKNSKNNKPETEQELQIAKLIYIYLNQGNLYKIYKILDELEDPAREQKIEKIFMEQYNFHFRKHI